MSGYTSGISPRTNFPTIDANYSTGSSSGGGGAIEEKELLLQQQQQQRRSSSAASPTKPNSQPNGLLKPIQSLLRSITRVTESSLPGGERRGSGGGAGAGYNRRNSKFAKMNEGIITYWSKKVLYLLVLVGFSLLLMGYYLFKAKTTTTLSFTKLEIEKIWRWEIASGRYPSFKKTGITFSNLLDLNPPPPPTGLDSNGLPLPATPKVAPKKVIIENPLWAGYGNGRERGGAVRAMVEGKVEMQMVGVGQERSYLQVRPRVPYSAWSGVELSSYPKRPTLNSVLDLDAVMDHCDYSQGKYVRDCLESLRLNAGLETGVRRGDMRLWEMTYITLEDGRRKSYNPTPIGLDMPTVLNSPDFNMLLDNQLHRTLSLPTSFSSHVHVINPLEPIADQFCNPEYPRIFHIFWAGPFTDKPYMAALSFLYTQRLNLHLPTTTYVPNLCRPQLWIWINPGSASSLVDENAQDKMLADLGQNPWSSPLLHHRFQDSIKFRLWNTTEQLDSVVEMKGWRDMKLFNGQVHYGDNLTNSEATRVGSKSQNEYDHLSVDLADMARFLLTHRYGGIYLDADTLLLRDWEELWGWKGSFGYRWSKLSTYNTAVLKMQKGSMIGSFIIRMAVKNGLDFHPRKVGHYLRDAGLEGLLMRLPDALFDPAWLNVEDTQRDRPAFPFFKNFGDFFNSSSISAAPNALSFDGFFRGAFSYHFHNFWWLPFDPSRNYPDLGARFMGGEKTAKATNLAASSLKLLKNKKKSPNAPPIKVQMEEEEELDLSWSTVLKRTFEAFLRGDRGNLYGEWIAWET